jgi:hypothetical protein
MHYKILSGKTARDKPRVMGDKRADFEGFEETHSRHFMPGYHRLVPPEQIQPRP